MDSNVLTTIGTAVAGLVLAIATAFGISAAASSEPEPIDDPVVLYGER